MNYWLLIPCILSSVSTILYVYLEIMKYRKPKDEIWETTLRLCEKDGKYSDSHHFAEVYEELKLFRDSGCDWNAMQQKKRMQQHIQQEQDSSEQGL